MTALVVWPLKVKVNWVVVAVAPVRENVCTAEMTPGLVVIAPVICGWLSSGA